MRSPPLSVPSGRSSAPSPRPMRPASRSMRQSSAPQTAAMAARAGSAASSTAKGKAGKARGGVDAPARIQFTGKQLQKRGLAAAVAAGERQFPGIVQFQRQAAEHRFRRALVGKRQIVYADDGHKKSPFRVQGRGQRRRRAGRPLRLKKDAPSRKDRHAKAAHCAPMACRFYELLAHLFIPFSVSVYFIARFRPPVKACAWQNFLVLGAAAWYNEGGIYPGGSLP